MPEATINQSQRLSRVFIFPTENCNSRCATCGYRENDDNCELSLAEIEELLDSLEQFHVNTVVFSGGEPLMHQSFFDMCAIIKERMPKIKLKLITNGILLKEQAEKVADFIDKATISLDGSSEQVYEKVRGTRHLGRVLEGIRRLKALKPKMHIQGKCTVQKGNFADMPNIVKLAGNMKLNRLCFCAPDTESDTAFGKRKQILDPSKIILDGEELEQLRDVLDYIERRFIDLFRCGFIKPNMDELRTTLVNHFARLLGQDIAPITPPCNRPLVSAVIGARGQVAPCFFQQPIGNLHVSSLTEIMSSKAMQRACELFRHRLINACKGCVCPKYKEPS